MTPGGFNEGWKDYRIDSLGRVLQRVAACCSVTFTNHAKNINHSQDIQLVPFQQFFFFESTCDYTRLTSDAPILVHLHSFVPICNFWWTIFVCTQMQLLVDNFAQVAHVCSCHVGTGSISSHYSV